MNTKGIKIKLHKILTEELPKEKTRLDNLAEKEKLTHGERDHTSETFSISSLKAKVTEVETKLKTIKDELANLKTKTGQDTRTATTAATISKNEESRFKMKK